MYPIDFMTCTARDVILRSLVCHPSCFADAITAQRSNHLHYARMTHDQLAKRSAEKQADACQTITRIVEETDAHSAADLMMASGITIAVIAFNVAANLTLCPPACRGDIIGRSNIGQA